MLGQPAPPCSSFAVSLSCIVFKGRWVMFPQSCYFVLNPVFLYSLRSLRGLSMSVYCLSLYMSPFPVHINWPSSSRFQVCIIPSSPEDKVSPYNKPWRQYRTERIAPNRTERRPSLSLLPVVQGVEM